ncbi:hypothetical protein BLNAU_10851 [Blattamonas nauphoetae]|uniref:Uncharacterized protein n=1 Tax=Blattamonas nauphoetae TaxID=2049346 RepID=A0ABQ9XQ55_9EUKA|nr:hypothetical protein BLNAU_10851 [Blattamonas nauphoetae]
MRTSFHPIFVALFSEESPSPTSFSVQCFKSLLSVSPGVSLGVIVGQNVDLEKLKLSLDSLLSPQTSIDYIPFFSENETTISPQMKLKSKAFASKYDPIVVMDTELYFVKDIIPSLKSFHESTKLIALTQSPLTHATLVKTVLQDPNTLRKLTSYLVVRSSLIISLFTNWENHWKELHQKPVLSNPLNPQESTTVPFDLLEQVSFNLALNKTLSIFDSTPNVQQQVVDHLPRTSFYVEKEVVHGLVGNGISQSSNRSLLNTPAMSVYSSASNESPRLPSSTKVSTTFVSNAITITHGLNEENEPDTPNVATTNRPLSVHSEIVRRYHDSPSVWTMGENVEREQREAEQRSQSPSLLHQPSLIRNQDQSNPQEPHKYGRIFFSDSPSPYMPSYPLVPLNHEGEFIAEQPVRLDDTHQTDINVSFSLNPAQHYVRQSDAKEKIHSSNSTSPSFHPHSDPKLIASPAPQQPSSRWSKGRTRRSLSTSGMEDSKHSDSVVHSSRFSSSFENKKMQTFRIELPMVHRSKPPKPTEETDALLSSLSLASSLTPNFRRPPQNASSPVHQPNQSLPPQSSSAVQEIHRSPMTGVNFSPYHCSSNRTSSRILPNMEMVSQTGNSSTILPCLVSSDVAQSSQNLHQPHSFSVTDLGEGRNQMQSTRVESAHASPLHTNQQSESRARVVESTPTKDRPSSCHPVVSHHSSHNVCMSAGSDHPVSIRNTQSEMDTFEPPRKVTSSHQASHCKDRVGIQLDGSESSESCHFDWGSRGCLNSLRSPFARPFRSKSPLGRLITPKTDQARLSSQSPSEHFDWGSRGNISTRRSSSSFAASQQAGIAQNALKEACIGQDTIEEADSAPRNRPATYIRSFSPPPDILQFAGFFPPLTANPNNLLNTSDRLTECQLPSESSDGIAGVVFDYTKCDKIGIVPISFKDSLRGPQVTSFSSPDSTPVLPSESPNKIVFCPLDGSGRHETPKRASTSSTKSGHKSHKQRKAQWRTDTPPFSQRYGHPSPFSQSPIVASEHPSMRATGGKHRLYHRTPNQSASSSPAIQTSEGQQNGPVPTFGPPRSHYPRRSLKPRSPFLSDTSPDLPPPIPLHDITTYHPTLSQWDHPHLLHLRETPARISEISAQSSTSGLDKGSDATSTQVTGYLTPLPPTQPLFHRTMTKSPSQFDMKDLILDDNSTSSEASSLSSYSPMSKDSQFVSPSLYSTGSYHSYTSPIVIDPFGSEIIPPGNMALTSLRNPLFNPSQTRSSTANEN